MFNICAQINIILEIVNKIDYNNGVSDQNTRDHFPADDRQQRETAKRFAEDWKGRGSEKSDSQPFWLSLLRRVFGIDNPEDYIKFEDKVHLDHTSFIDVTIQKRRINTNGY